MTSLRENPKMNAEVPMRLVLVAPPDGVDFGLQRGKGSNYETVAVQQRGPSKDLTFDFSLTVAESAKGTEPNFLGPFAQGPAAGRFVYVDVGTYAGQKNTPWSRRIKIPLGGITWALIKKTLKTPGARLVAKIPGTGKDGSPSCATVRLIGDWEVVTDRK
jgi:uncharacterized protein DUF5990